MIIKCPNNVVPLGCECEVISLCQESWLLFKAAKGTKTYKGEIQHKPVKVRVLLSSSSH